MDVISFTAALKHEATASGFTLTGACPAVTPQGITPLKRWLEAGFGGEMTYIVDRLPAYEHPHHVLSGARSLLMLGIPYGRGDLAPCGPGEARVARYAWGRSDYHEDVHGRLRRLSELATVLQPGVRVRGVIDTSPLLEREFAQLAGLGWIGKNTMLLNRHQGSWFFLAALLLDCELDYDEPHVTSHCGTCTACLDACPTGAFPEPFVLDATRCISYLTIELRGAIPLALRDSVGNWLFGCDICQEVCPWNRKRSMTLGAYCPRGRDVPTTTPAEAPLGEAWSTMDVHSLFELTDETFRQWYRHTAFWRARRRGLLRNAAIVLGNLRSSDSHPTLARAMLDAEPLVRGAAAWALGRIGTAAALQTLRQRLFAEEDLEVRAEIQNALNMRVADAISLSSRAGRYQSGLP